MAPLRYNYIGSSEKNIYLCHNNGLMIWFLHADQITIGKLLDVLTL